MPGVATIGMMTVGVDGPPTVISSSPAGCSVIAQGINVATIGSVIVPHKKYGSKHTHPRVVAAGSSNVVVNGVALAMTGSLCSDGDILGPSIVPTVIVNGQ